MTNSELRNKFLEKGFNYSVLRKEHMKLLFELLNKELSVFNNKGFTMKVRGFRKKDVAYDLDGSLLKCFITVKGNHFDRREAISFNPNGFIGFAGWADSTNVQPFQNAFNKWIENLKL